MSTAYAEGSMSRNLDRTPVVISFARDEMAKLYE
jgi:hypothetical protein